MMCAGHQDYVTSVTVTRSGPELHRCHFVDIAAIGRNVVIPRSVISIIWISIEKINDSFRARTIYID